MSLAGLGCHDTSVGQGEVDTHRLPHFDLPVAVSDDPSVRVRRIVDRDIVQVQERGPGGHDVSYTAER